MAKLIRILYLTKTFTFALFFILLASASLSAANAASAANFSIKNQVYLKIVWDDPQQFIDAKTLVRELARSPKISIDKVNEDEQSVYIYTTDKHWPGLKNWCLDNNENCKTVVLTNPSLLIKPKMTKDILQSKKSNNEDIGSDGNSELLGTWNAYPTYPAYVNYLKQMTQRYSNIAKLIDLGKTSRNHQMLIVKISENPNLDRGRPKFLFDAGIHGDELAGTMMMLQFIEYLLNNYQSDPRVKRIVNNSEIWINALVNPDGTYSSGDNSVRGATRSNGNGVDLNRNAPDPKAGDHPDYEQWQPETLALINLSKEQNFIFSFQFHGGVEVLNYPWDTFQRLHPDDNWYRYISRLYVDTIRQKFPNLNYMNAFEDGITNGYAWYEVEGGRQDYLGYFNGARAITAEVSDYKMVPESDLVKYFQYNLESLLLSLEKISFGNGFSGQVINKSTGTPISQAEIMIVNHDADNSQVRSQNGNGYFYRPIMPGDYQIKVSAPGFQDLIVPSVKVERDQNIFVNIGLIPL